MSHVLITGMTASQASHASLKRFHGYAGQITQALSYKGHTSEMTPSPTDLDQYDAVLVGLAPVLSLGSNNAFQALSLIDELMSQNDPRLVFFVDAPTPAHITASLTSINNNRLRLTKDLFKKRPGFPVTQHKLDTLVSAVQRLTDDPWPTTIAPVLPWGSSWDSALPLADSTPVSLNLDAVRSQGFESNNSDRLQLWVSDQPESKWVDKTRRHIDYVVVDIKENRFSTDEQVRARMSRAVGTILVPQRDGATWWSPRYLDSLKVGTPVATEWRESQVISAAWGVLPSTIEELDGEERTKLAINQMSSYFDNIPTLDEGSSLLEKTLGIG